MRHGGSVERRRYAIETFGCRVNQADAVGLATHLDEGSWDRVTEASTADVVVLNTCTVTHRSDADVRKAVSRLKRDAPQAKVIVTGCMAQRAPDELVRIRGVAGILGNAEKHRIRELADRVSSCASDDRATPEVWRTAFDPDSLPKVNPVAGVLDRSRPFPQRSRMAATHLAPTASSRAFEAEHGARTLSSCWSASAT
ncbi:MAG: hypothetical protein HC923_01290 [Myxococcales bacterium]|nr:hypothetical protein [Myxococcales bacterium]